MRKGRVIMGTAVRQFEYLNKNYLRQGVRQVVQVFSFQPT